MKPKFRSFLLAGTSLLAISYAHAAGGTWKGNSGAWSDATNDADPLIGVWIDGIVADGADSTANFTGVNIAAGQAITLDDIGRTIGNITFTDATTSSHNLTISGTNTLTLDRTDAIKPVIDVTQSGRQLSISSVIAGGDGLQKNGAGDLSMSGANTFTGGIDLSAGRIVVFNDANEQSFLGDAANVLTITGNNAELYCSNSEATLPQSLTINDGITGRITGAFGERTIVNGVVAGSGTMVVNAYSAGFDVQLRNTANTFSGPIQILSGDSVTLGMASLVDSANTISMASVADDSGAFIYLSQAAAPLVLDNRQFNLVNNGNAGTNTGRLPGIKNNAGTANTVTVNTDLLITGTGNKSFVLGGGNTGNNAFNGLLADKVVDVPDPDPDIVYKLSILKQDGGKWILGDVDNSYTGATTISGTLEVTKLANGGSNSGIGASTNDAGNLVLNNTGVLRYTGSGDSTDRAFNLAGTGNSHTFSFDSSGSGAVSLTNTATPGFGTTNQTRTVKLIGGNTGANTFAATLTNNGTSAVSLTKEGAGKWVVTGANSYTGATTVTAGTLLVNGDQSLATGAVNVNGGVLGGTGILGGNVTVAAAGSVAPGASVGTLSIGGNLTISAMAGGAGTLNYELGTTAASDKIAVTGTLAIGTDVLDFTDFAFTDAGGLQNGTYTLISSGSPVSGTLDPIPANLTGAVGIGTGTLQVSLSGTDIELVVSGIGPDVTAPTLASSNMVDNQGGGPIAVGTLVTYTVTFSEDMNHTTVTAADFEDGGTSAASIGSVSETSPGVFSVQATPNNAGTLILQVKAGAILEDTSGNDLDTTSAIADNTTINVTVADPYAAWSGGAAFDGDANGDGVDNGLAFLLGAAGPNVSALGLLPVVTHSSGNLVLTFNCLKAANRGSASLNVEHSSNLGISDPWTAVTVPETSGGPTSGVTFTVTPGGGSTNGVVATVSSSEAASGKLFGRLRANP